MILSCILISRHDHVLSKSWALEGWNLRVPQYWNLFCGINCRVFEVVYWRQRRSQWPRGLRRRSAAARLLGSWVRIPPGHGCLSVVSVVCCRVEVSATSWSHVQESYPLWRVVVCDLETSRMRRPWPALGRRATRQRKIIGDSSERYL